MSMAIHDESLLLAVTASEVCRARALAAYTSTRARSPLEEQNWQEYGWLYMLKVYCWQSLLANCAARALAAYTSTHARARLWKNKASHEYGYT